MHSPTGLVIAALFIPLFAAAAFGCDNDGSCGYGENCENCPNDCPTASGDCCNPSLYPLNKGRAENGLQWAESGTSNYYICCSGTAYQGSCCSDSDCGSGYTCSGHTCTESPGGEPSGCGGAQCMTSNGGYCSSNDGCESGNCINSVCCASGQTCCSTDSACSSGYRCGDNHYCVYTGRANGASCSSNSECESGNCNRFGNQEVDSSSNVCCAYGEKCCDYSYYAGTPIILGDTTYECTYNYYLVEKAKECGDGTCSSGENCLSCPSDCGCSSGECCASQSSYYHTDDSRGCADSGELIAGSIDGERSFCCEGNILAEGTDTCCFDSQCKEGQQCKHEFGGESKLAYCIAAPSPGTGASPGAGQQGAGATQPGASQPAAGAAQASASFLESFYSNYDLSPVMSVADKKYVPRSSFYAGLSTFYKGQAEYIDMPVAGLGKFTLIMDTLNDLTRSVVSVNPISFAIEIGEFMDELSQKIPEAGPLQNLVLNAYSVGSLAAGVSEETGWGQAAITKLTSKLPSNRVLTAITKRQAALQAKIMPDQASKSQFFLLDAADFVMDQTLMYYVRQEFDYAMVDFSEKIQLSIMAGELSRLYAKAEVHSLSEAEAVMLMETEYNFWNMVIARDTNVISNERAKSLVERAWSSVIERVLLANYGDSISSAEQVIGVAQQRLDMVKYGIDRVFGS